MFTDILWWFLILETFVLGAAYTDFCNYYHPQKQLCTSQFVLKVKFRKLIHVPVRYTFRTKIIKVLEGNVTLLNITENRYVNVVTDEYSNFFVGRKYIIFGDNKNGNLYTDICFRNMPWKYTKLLYISLLEIFYKYDCECLDEVLADPLCQALSAILKKRNTDCYWVKPEYGGLCENGVLEYEDWV